MALISTEGTKAYYKRQFWSFLTIISYSKYKKLDTLIRWHTVDSWLAYSWLMKNGVCQLFLKFAYWVTAFWIRWPDYKVIQPNVKVTRDTKSLILTRIRRFRSVTPDWIHRWLWNDVQSLQWHRKCALLLPKVIRQISRSHGTKIVNFDPQMGVSGV